MLKIINNVVELQYVIAQFRSAGKSVGFVPTMGALHQGHLSLIQQSRRENDITICSIFVNPTQFNDKEDYKHYPRSLETDSRMLEAAGCDILFYPSEDEMYPSGAEKKIDFDPGELGQVLEGSSRPGHFAGVAAVVKRLFDIVKPDKAYFGQKDYQQFLIVQKMARDFKLPVAMVMCPILREANGLAMSSRNERLSAEERMEAGLIYRILSQAAEKVRQRTDSVEGIKSWAAAEFAKKGNFQLDYFDICSAKSLQPVKEILDSEPLLICTAVRLGKVRLIDNMLV